MLVQNAICVDDLSWLPFTIKYKSLLLDVSPVPFASDPASVGLKHSPKPSKLAADCNSRPWSSWLMNSFPFQFTELIAPANRGEHEMVSVCPKTLELIA